MFQIYNIHPQNWVGEHWTQISENLKYTQELIYLQSVMGDQLAQIFRMHRLNGHPHVCNLYDYQSCKDDFRMDQALLDQ